MRLDELPRSANIEDRRGTRLGGPMGRTGGLGIGTIIILGLIGWAFGINPLYLIGGAARFAKFCQCFSAWRFLEQRYSGCCPKLGPVS
jgi:predicted metalloprotease